MHQVYRRLHDLGVFHKNFSKGEIYLADGTKWIGCYHVGSKPSFLVFIAL
jgi:hypothetical protein